MGISRTLFCKLKAGAAGETSALCKVCVYLWRVRPEAVSSSRPGEGTLMGMALLLKDSLSVAMVMGGYCVFLLLGGFFSMKSKGKTLPDYFFKKKQC